MKSFFKRLIYYIELYCDLFFKYMFNHKLYSKKYDIVFYLNSPIDIICMEGVIFEAINKKALNILVLARFNMDNDFKEYISKYDVIYNTRYRIFKILKTSFLITTTSGKVSKPKGSYLVYILHSLIGFDDVYKLDLFEPFDIIISATSYQTQNFLNWRERNLNLKDKIILKGGYPRVDFLNNTYELYKKKTKNNMTVIYAPTYSNGINTEFATINKYGIRLVEYLLKNGFSVIFRPHPGSLHPSNINNNIAVKEIIETFNYNNNFNLDLSPNYEESYFSANFMITDFSGTGFTFMFATYKPTLFLSFSEKNLAVDIINELDILCDSFDELKIKIKRIINNEYKKEIIKSTVQTTLYNHLCSSETIIDRLLDFRDNKMNERDFLKL